MPSNSPSAEIKNRKLAEALKSNMARRKAVSKIEPMGVPVSAAPVDIFVDDDEDTTSPLGGCCAGCR